MRPTDGYRQKQRRLLWRERAINEASATEIQAKVNMIDAESRRQLRHIDSQKKLLEYEMGDQRSSGILLQEKSSMSASSSISSSSSETSIPPASSSTSIPCSETSTQPPEFSPCKIHGQSSHCRYYPCQEVATYHSIRDGKEVSKLALERMGTDSFEEEEEPRPLTTAELRQRGLRYMANQMRRYRTLVTREWATIYGGRRS